MHRQRGIGWPALVSVRALVSASILLALASTAGAQHYDPYYVLPGPAGRIGADLGLANRDMTEFADASTMLAMGKYSISDQLEVGASADLGVLQESASSLIRVQAGAKMGLAPDLAITGAVVLPVGDIDDPGVAVGAMKSLFIGGTMVNTWAQGAFLDGYAIDGVSLSLLIEPVYNFGDLATGYFDILIASNTDALGDHLALNLGPNAELNLNETAIINVGLTIGLAGDARQDDMGLNMSLITAF